MRVEWRGREWRAEQTVARVRLQERMNSPLEKRKIRLRGL
jgi:hypothetical protein